ncbi:hypothetical protein [Bradyrhizobium sp. CCBAU 51627]|uniref:hypothetical protein n=1 Tax=Bradyrhizobium sp. CCBAU 51627 TaxID=1325088 RepID=UPI002306495B|nr:hypothetical protein [Bradyrhizobium sp. CCBAU 51627]
MEAIDVPDDVAMVGTLPGAEFAPRWKGIVLPETVAFDRSPGRSGAKTGFCPTLVRRTINRRIDIQEMSGQQTFDAIIGVIIFSS